MSYTVWIRDDRMICHELHEDYFLEGLYPVDQLTVQTAEQLDLCQHCELAYHCHPIESGTGRKMCTVLFHDVIKPAWRPEDLV